jgi:hypothetical protein
MYKENKKAKNPVNLNYTNHLYILQLVILTPVILNNLQHYRIQESEKVMTTTTQARIDAQSKKEAQKILNGISGRLFCDGGFLLISRFPMS